MQKADFVMMLKRFGHVEEYPTGRKEVRLNLDEIAGELEQLFHKHHVIGSLPLYAVNRVEVIDEEQPQQKEKVQEEELVHA